jgi:hypothetical protein
MSNVSEQGDGSFRKKLISTELPAGTLILDGE